MKCHLCKKEVGEEYSEIKKWEDEPVSEMRDKPINVCNDCMEEHDFKERVRNMSDKELKEMRSGLWKNNKKE